MTFGARKILILVGALFVLTTSLAKTTTASAILQLPSQSTLAAMTVSAELMQAQQPPPPQAQAQSPDPQPDPPATAQPAPSKGKPANDRLFFALPNYLTVENPNGAQPLTAKQKFSLEARSAFDYYEFGWIGLISAIGQASDSEPEYGQGLKGYAKRYGTNFADSTVENFMVSAIAPSVLHQDPRFYETSTGSFSHRFVYAAGTIFITRSDSGKKQFNFSEVVGALAAAFLSNYSYHPKEEKNVANALSVWGSQLAYDAITFELKEFWPDLHKAFAGHRKHPSAKPQQ